jgi:hypothetical protein
MLQQDAGMPCVLGRHEVDVAQNFERAQGDIAQISNWRCDNVKHLASSDQNRLCAIVCAWARFWFSTKPNRSCEAN